MVRFRRMLAPAAMVWMLASCVTTPAAAQRYDQARNLVQRVQEDLHQVRQLGPRNAKERERIDNARKHLSDFDRNLKKGRFDKGRLDSAIDDVKNVVEHNTLESRDRDALTNDLENLRQMRRDRGR